MCIRDSDGIHGVTFASVQFAEEAEEGEPVQVGDAALGKALLEATLEVIERNLVLGVQDPVSYTHLQRSVWKCPGTNSTATSLRT